jgi:hypothetical protein
MTALKRSQYGVASDAWRSARHGTLSAIFDLYKAEIDAHRARLTEECAHDVGWEWAAVEWLNDHCPKWRLVYWESLVDQERRDLILKLGENSNAPDPRGR